MNNLYRHLENAFLKRGERFMVATLSCPKTQVNVAIMSVEDGLYIGFPILREVRDMKRLQVSADQHPEPLSTAYLVAPEGFMDIAAPMIIDASAIGTAEYMMIDGCCMEDGLRRRLEGRQTDVSPAPRKGGDVTPLRTVGQS